MAPGCGVDGDIGTTANDVLLVFLSMLQLGIPTIAPVKYVTSTTTSLKLLSYILHHHYSFLKVLG